MTTMKTIARALLLFGCSSAGRGHITPKRGLSSGLLEEDLSCIGCELNSKGSASDLPGTAPLALMIEVTGSVPGHPWLVGWGDSNSDAFSALYIIPGSGSGGALHSYGGVNGQNNFAKNWSRVAVAWSSNYLVRIYVDDEIDADERSFCACVGEPSNTNRMEGAHSAEYRNLTIKSQSLGISPVIWPEPSLPTFAARGPNAELEDLSFPGLDWYEFLDLEEWMNNLPTPAPTGKPTAAPSPAPSSDPGSEPSSEPMAAPSPAPTGEPTAWPSPAPTGERPAPTGEPTPVPSLTPTDAPTTVPSPAPTGEPTAPPSPAPTGEPTPVPSLTPTDAPTTVPSPAPTWTPAPSLAPSPNVCVCTGGTPAEGEDCRVNGSNLCKSCNDGWEKDTIDVPGTCYFPNDFCDDPKFHESDEELGTCYSEIAHTVGRGEVSVTKEWSGTDTTSWEVCRDVGSEVEVCAETSFVIPKVFLPLELGLCSTGTVSIDLCSSETRELAQTQSTSVILQGIVAHSVFACLKGRHYVVEDEGNATFVTYKKNFYLFCARPVADQRGGCPGVPCAGVEVYRPDLEPGWPEIPNGAGSGRQAAGLMLVAAGAAAAAT